MIILILLLPSLYFAYRVFAKVFEKLDKKNRIHKTKAALTLLLISYVFITIIHYYAFNIINEQYHASYWIYGSILYLSVSLISLYAYIVVIKSKSKKNITKLVLIIFYLILYIPLFVWMNKVYSVGIYDGKFGISQKQSKKIVDEKIGAGINHNIISAKKDDGSWLVTADLFSQDGKIKISKEYYISLNSGDLNKRGSEIKINLFKSGEIFSGGELILLEDLSIKNGTTKRRGADFAVTDSNGQAEITIPESDNDFYLQIRDCTFMCQNYLYKLSKPHKNDYSIDLNPMQSNVGEL